MDTPHENKLEFFRVPDKDDRSSDAHRQLIGYTGMLLPALLWFISSLRPIEGIPSWVPLSSISAYYYTGAVSAFAGGLIALAMFLFSYRGYDNVHGHHDRFAAIIAGGAAVLVAFFPTEAPKGFKVLSWWTPLTGWIHYSSAVILFGSFIFFCLFQFPRSNLDNANLPREKRVRNRFYMFCGLAILGCMGWAFIAHRINVSIFLPEALALEFFALSWLMKGRADKTALAVSRQTLHYGRHPRQLVDNVWSAIRGNGG